MEAKLTVDFMHIYSPSAYAQQGGTLRATAQIPVLFPEGTRTFKEIAQRQVNVVHKGMLSI